MDTFYIDVRETDEYEIKHIEGSLNAPLSKFEIFLEPIQQMAEKLKIVLVCKSGVRSSKALSMVQKKAGKIEIETLEGGIDQWEKEGKGLSTKKSGGSVTIIRQVMIVAGLLVLFGSLGSLYINNLFIWLSVFVGAGLTFAGLSGICLMAKILGAMPWNK